MPSPLRPASGPGLPAPVRAALRRGRSPAARIALVVLLAAGLGAMVAAGCRGAGRGPAPRAGPRLYPPHPQPPRVVALGTLRGAPPPARGELELARFLFGAEPRPALALARPTALVARDDYILICDSVLDAVLRCDTATGRIAEVRCVPPPVRPSAIDVTPAGDWLLCDARGARRIGRDGETRAWYTLPDRPLKPGGILAVDDAVWISNLAAHAIEVFDAAGAAHRRTIGGRGRGPAEFAFPRGLARTPAGEIGVADMLNNRVQILDRDGTWLRDIGQPGDVVGAFGRPRDLAVGPDGTVFVSDAFSQRIHAFAPDGAPLLAFGEPGSGVGALALPAGVAVAAAAPPADQPLAPGLTAACFVLVADELADPGVRVYAWLAGPPERAAEPLPPAAATDWQPRLPGSAALNPHWHPERCNACHPADRGRLAPIALADSDALCLSCHDGVQAPADPHPIGRPAVTELVHTPPEWPTVAGMIGCLTCHDIRRHCDPGARRPAVNPGLLRGWDPQRPLDYCMTCHTAEIGARFSPHRQRDAAGRVREDACLFCHTQHPEIPPDGRRRFNPLLRAETSRLCLNCHRPHWDLSPRGHVDRPVTPAIRQWMLMRELGAQRDADPQRLAELARQLGRPPARLPLGAGQVTCYTCHNPHYAGLFPEGSELGALASHPADRAAALRKDWIDLCSECHHH